MKEIFFKALVIALPLVIVGGLIYFIFIGFYSFFSDMRLKKELDQISREAKDRRKQQPDEDKLPTSYSVEDLFKK